MQLFSLDLKYFVVTSLGGGSFDFARKVGSLQFPLQFSIQSWGEASRPVCVARPGARL